MDDVILARTDKTEIRCLVASDGTAAAATEAIERKGYRLLFCVGIGRGGGSRTVGVDDLRWDYAELSGGRIPILVLLWPLGRDDDYFFQHLPACQADGAPNLSRASTSPRPSIVSQRVFENLLHSSHSCSFVHSKWSDSSLPRESCLGHLSCARMFLRLRPLSTPKLRQHLSLIHSKTGRKWKHSSAQSLGRRITTLSSTALISPRTKHRPKSRTGNVNNLIDKLRSSLEGHFIHVSGIVVEVSTFLRAIFCICALCFPVFLPLSVLPW
ncbi:hypothetical protein JOL62DRAFT_42682 [Phyllosticta paracitricarpa]|uniref:Uncharacterized protein n=1 Tax=Phyllosticta paracitricarpa TaxID=2016321 RepID=A0ABR1N936_9PEZI